MHVGDAKERILGVLKRRDKVPIYVVAKEAQLSITTASKYCYILQAENKVRIESFGNMKLVSRRGHT